MILTDQCYLKDKCYKFSKKSKSCQDFPQFCPKLFRTNFLLEEALLSENQRRYTPLAIDADGTDRE